MIIGAGADTIQSHLRPCYLIVRMLLLEWEEIRVIVTETGSSNMRIDQWYMYSIGDMPSLDDEG